LKRFIFSLIIFISVCSLFAEDLKGKVYDINSTEPILSVAVTIAELNWISYTDEAGRFIIKDLEAGTYSLKISRIGYGEFYTTIIFPECGELLIGIERRTHEIEGYSVSSHRIIERETPVTFSSINSEQLNEANFGQDLPMLINDMTNVYSYSDAGNGYGYSYMKVRGFDQKRIGVMVNGIPLNDPEDHQVYWVDLPDIAESVEEIQFQRGVGSTIYGVSSFGGSLNLDTNNLAKDNEFEVYTALGSYNTYKAGAKFARIISEKYRMNFRISHIKSDGYRHNTASEMSSFYAGFARVGERSVTELNIYGGKELVHAGWYASWEEDLKKDHQHNPIEYDNEIDDFLQPHFELHHNYMINSRMNIQNSLFYIMGDGFYEQFKEGRDLWEYGLASEPDTQESDLIRKKMVLKHQYGWIGQFRRRQNNGELILGAYLSLFNSDHNGEVKELLGTEIEGFKKGFEYYRYEGNRKNLVLFLNKTAKPVEALSIMFNLHYQHLNVEFDQREAGNFTGAYLNSYKVTYNFFNPRIGANYNFNRNLNVYANVSRSHREPTDGELYDTWDGPDDLNVQPLFAEADTVYDQSGEIARIKWENPFVKEEKLIDYELGMGFSNHKLNAKFNVFWMDFENEIVAFGDVDDDGSPIRGNADRTVHRGIELSAEYTITDQFTFSGNFSYNDNYFKEFKQYDYDNVMDYSGNKIAGFPDIVSSSKLTYTLTEWKIFAQMQYIGKQYLDNTENDDRIIEPFDLMNLGINYKMKNLLNLADVVVNFQINNILDKKYETAGYYDPWGGDDWSGANYYFPGAERNFMLGIRAEF
jgi:iron complex outermembrane recepter protein